MAKIATFRRGAYVRYVGNDQRMKETWKNSIHRIERKYGNMAAGYFPMRYGDGSIHCCRYAVPISELEIVVR